MSGVIYAFNRPADRFTIVSNDLIEDTELKHAAFRIVVYIGRHAANFRLTQYAIGRALGMDRGTVARHLVHLEELGYLRRVPNFSAEGRQADDLYVSQERLSAEQWEEALPSQCCKTPHCKTQHGKTPQRKKTNSKKTKREEDQPSGGSAADAPSAPEPDPSTEEDMPRAAAPDQPGLFDAPVVEKPRAPRKEAKLPEGAAAVVAGFVESYEQSHGGTRPLRSDIGRVAAAAKLILRNGEATLEHLVSCARKMGHGPYANLYQELKFSRPSTHGAVPRAVLHGDPRWDDVHTSIHLDEATLNAPVEAWA